MVLLTGGLATCLGMRLAEIASTQPAENLPGPEQERVSQADLLVAMAADAELFHSASRDCYATIEQDGHRETWRIDSPEFGDWLSHRFYEEHQKAVTSLTRSTATEQLKAKALFDGDEHEVHLRVASSGEVIWLDLCDQHWRAVRISPSGWEIVASPPVRFTRRTGMRPLPPPERSPTTNLNPLFDLLHVEQGDTRLLLTALCVNVLSSPRSYPVLTLTGEQGSGKTTLARMLHRLLDPHDMETRSPPRNEEDLAIAAQHGLIISYENLSTISDTLSDAFCRMSTGGSFGGRKLYSNDHERQLRFCRPLILNGIEDLATRSDLADRCVMLQMPTIPTSHRQTETQLWSEFEKLHPTLLGSLLDLLVAVLRMPDPELQLERMAEFSVLGAKVAIALGRSPAEFTAAYRANRDQASALALESSAIGPPLLRVVRPEPFVGPMAGLMDRLNKVASDYERRHPGWPRSPRALSSELRRLAPNLRRAGIIVMQLGHRADGNWIEVEMSKLRVDVQDVQDAQQADDNEATN